MVVSEGLLVFDSNHTLHTKWKGVVTLQLPPLSVKGVAYKYFDTFRTSLHLSFSSIYSISSSAHLSPLFLSILLFPPTLFSLLLPLSPAKIVGGMTWCIQASNFDVDVDLLFQENSTIGQKM